MDIADVFGVGSDKDCMSLNEALATYLYLKDQGSRNAHELKVLSEAWLTICREAKKVIAARQS